MELLSVELKFAEGLKISFLADDIEVLRINNVVESYHYIHDEGKVSYARSTDNVVISLNKKADKILRRNSVGFEETIFGRIKAWNDIEAITLNYKGDVSEKFLVEWGEDDEYESSYQSSYFSDTALVININKNSVNNIYNDAYCDDGR